MGPCMLPTQQASEKRRTAERSVQTAMTPAWCALTQPVVVVAASACGRERLLSPVVVMRIRIGLRYTYPYYWSTVGAPTQIV